MLTCRQLYNSADLLTQQSVPLSRALSYRVHLLLCSNCRRYVQQYHQLGQAYALRVPPLVPEAEMQKLLQTLQAGQTSKDNNE